MPCGLIDELRLLFEDMLHACMQANFSSDCRGMQAQLSALCSLVRLLDPQLSAFLVRPCRASCCPVPNIMVELAGIWL